MLKISSLGKCKWKQVRHTTHLLRWRKPWNTDIKCWQGMQNEDSLAVLIKLNILWSHNPATAFFDTYPNKLNTYVHTKTCIQLLITALLIIHKTWKQPRCSSVDQWVNCGTSRQVSYQPMKRFGGNLNAWYEVREANVKSYIYRFPMIQLSGKDKTTETIKRSVVTSYWGEGIDRQSADEL
jgi:hypothetical protein